VAVAKESSKILANPIELKPVDKQDEILQVIPREAQHAA
jgi:hypothetical protein